MLPVIKKILYQLLGPRRYLGLVSRTYLLLLLNRCIRPADKHFLRRIIRPDFHCIDIGANLGYYSIPLSRLAPNGQVHAVEPVPLFRKVLRGHIQRYRAGNITVYPCALGREDGTQVTMHTPVVDGVFRHGLTSIESTGTGTTYSVEMRNPALLFGQLDRVDYIKCDVEGYEHHIIPLLEPLIRQHAPVLQIEMSRENQQTLLPLLTGWGYRAYLLQKDRLTGYDATQPAEGDVYLFREAPAELLS